MGVTLFFAGCVAPTLMTADETAAAANGAHVPVVAVLDTGVNPYHDWFAASPALVETRVGNATVLRLSDQPDFESALEEDAAMWSAMEPRQLYHFSGTRISAISFLSPDAQNLVIDPHGHGTATASVVAAGAPETVLVVVQVDARLCLERRSCLVDPSVVDGLEWAASQPWIDVISMSFGLPANLPDVAAVHPEAQRFVNATRAAHAAGKAVVRSAGNDPSPTFLEYMDGPPWVTVVGGADGSGRGETAFAARGVDFMANYTTTVAAHDSRHLSLQQSGTSFSAPVVAAALGSALAHVRGTTSIAPTAACATHDGATAVDVLAALNVTARAFNPGEWSPGASANAAAAGNPTRASVPLIAPGVQGGWGFVDDTTARGAAIYFTCGEAATPSAKPEVAAYMRARQDVRTAIWAAN